MRRWLSLLALLMSASACGSSTPTSATLPPTSSGSYSQTDLVVGTGATAATGNRVTVIYTGWLYDTSRTQGKGNQFDSNTISFTLGAGQVIRGWDQGIAGMRIGGQRRLIIPPELAYGSTSPSASIPPNATLVFDVTLTAVQ
jgi:FKBP-type peptidyl-prolyl cis-trans isomerase FkpA